jgi:RimJ/RimL family protein N-acetyltransferase
VVEPVILGGRVVRLMPLEPAAVDGLLLAANERRDSYGYTLVPATAEEMHRYVLAAREDQRSGWALPFVISHEPTGRIVGSTRFLDLAYWDEAPAWPPGRPSAGGEGSPSAAEIGSTWLAASVQRTAVNTEAKFLMLQHAFEVWRVARVTLKTDARNERSRRAIERIGAQFEGIRRAHLPATDGTVRDTAYYSIVRDEWPALRDVLERRLEREVAGHEARPRRAR